MQLLGIGDQILLENNKVMNCSENRSKFRPVIVLNLSALVREYADEPNIAPECYRQHG
ncbi:MAG: hypothetical protein KTR27_15390 [Leptolyngbyaceae cyanobacterium MAG.088]|nr:hypothetical protein [Leptolyngbyaceae cyanobacterium MAG.088]